MFQEPKLFVNDRNIGILNAYSIKEEIKCISGCSWNPRKKVWEVPATEEALDMLLGIAPKALVDPLVYTLVEKETSRLKCIANQKDIPWQQQTAIRPMPLKRGVVPFQHQVAAYNTVGTIFGIWDNALRNSGAGLYMEQGTGKTLTAIAVAGRMFLDGHIKRALVVSPMSVVPVWPQEFQAFAGFPYIAHALEGDSKKKIKALESLAESQGVLQVAVVNYESAWRIYDAIRAWGPDLVILDESQRIKNPGARQSKALHNLGKITSFRMILTGTPVSQGPLDFFSQLKFADPTILGSSYYAAKAKYAITGGYENRQIIGYKDLPEFTKRVHSIGFRVTKAEALDLPEQLPPQVRYCELEKEARIIYSKLAKDSVTELENEKTIVVQNVLSKLLRLSQLAGGYYSEAGEKPIEVSRAKINLLEEILDDLGGQQVVIFARFLAEISAIKALLDKKGITYRYIDGSVSMRERGEAVKEFQSGNCQVFIAQIQTAGLGITLNAASVAIFYSLDYSYANLEQAMARLHRIGQKNVVTIIFLITRGTVDEKVVRALEEKEGLAKLVVDNWKLLFEEGFQ